ncbi:MAG TPA: diacylglycerol kinase [Desulfopila sp.]|nr:diacylglycerol kinase [Desulfopila sp.]
MKQQKPTLQRILHACFHSRDGFISTYRGEVAFRQEVWASCLLLPLLFFLPLQIFFKVLLVGAHFIVLITEILNTAIEKIVDLVSPEFNELAKKAKDMGSAAVFLSLVLAALLWLTAIGSLVGHG